jgi:DNA-directed RNA polymerase sigma subunit (sigma70/sigma32)
MDDQNSEISKLKEKITPEMEADISRMCGEIKNLESKLGRDFTKNHITKALKKMKLTDAQRAIIKERLGY